MIYPRVPVFVVEASGEYATLLTYLEGLLDMIWVSAEILSHFFRLLRLLKRCHFITVSYHGRNIIQKGKGYNKSGLQEGSPRE